jgi:hypothetical protein
MWITAEKYRTIKSVAYVLGDLHKMEQTVCVTVTSRLAESLQNRTLVNKKICRLSTKLSFGDILEEVIGDKEVGKDLNYALDHQLFEAKLSTTENSEPFTIDKNDTLQTALDFNPQILEPLTDSLRSMTTAVVA